jgi:hypothetical protein
MTGVDPEATRGALADELDDLRSRRRTLASGSALFGSAPVLHALAPQLLPSLVRGLSALFWATLCALLAVGLEELLTWRRQQRHVNQR